ncbi:hypothetical protein [Halalkalibacter oceani]|uniref:hypothetical protein n=1 Tax=Halalkalibacter oceani TaxID=1653776 RepID=UPI003399AF80
MKAGEMLGYTKRLKEITSSKLSHQRDVRLANLMTDLEAAYQIPLVGKERIERFKAEQPFAWRLYHAVSDARTL